MLSKTDRPLLIVHSTDDATVSHKLNFVALQNALKEKGNIQFLSVSGSGHSPHYTADAFAYKEAFFKELKKQRRKGRLKTKEQKLAFASRYDWRKMTAQNESVWNVILEFIAN